jgi:polyhydroxyalkanoate synthesis regulator phasin
MIRKLIPITVFGLIAANATPASAQDSGALIDKLVQKGVLSDQEAEDVRADLTKEYNQTSAGKLNISTSIKELKFYGDARYRYQYDDQQAQIVNPNHVQQRSRNRFRLRLYTDIKFNEGFFGGFGLESANAADSGMQTVDPGYADSNIYISRYFLGYNFGEAATVILGKQKNPFYHNELYWDADINPVGVTESIAIHKLFGYEEHYQPSTAGTSKDGKSIPSGTTTSTGFNWGNFELTLVAGQLVYSTDNSTNSSTNEADADSDSSNDVYMFQQQLVASYKWENKVSATFAPAFIFYNAGDLGPEASSSNAQPFVNATGVSGESRDLLVINAPGDIKFPIGSLNGKFYWDVALNLAGEDRYTDVYQLGFTVPRENDEGVIVDVDPVSGSAPTSPLRAHEDKDDLAYIVGLEIGAGKGKGAWTLFANYRQVGITSIDPNLNDSDFALSRLNIKGWRAGVTYGLTENISIAATAQLAEDLDDSIRGGHATGGAALADRNAVNTYQFDVNWKF